VGIVTMTRTPGGISLKISETAAFLSKPAEH